MRKANRIGVLIAFGMLVTTNMSIITPVNAALPIFVDVLGFEDDVDLVVQPNGQFMVVPEETENGLDAQVTVLELDSFTGEPLGVLFEEEVLGFENGVDPIIIGQETGRWLILVPVESEDGSEAMVVQIYVEGDGELIDQRDIELGDLGFRPDVDGIWSGYAGAIGFFALESEDRMVRGVLAIDVDDRDGDWGSCFLLSTDGREEPCDDFEEAEYLPGMPLGVDPISYPIGDRLRFAVPVETVPGGDLLFFDFDNDVEAGDVPPFKYPGYTSVKDENEGGIRPLEFPGYEWDVDMIHFGPGQCHDRVSIVVPVEGPDDVADLYFVDGEFATAIWAYSIDGDPSVPIPGYEIGVDVMAMCGLVGIDPENRLAVPVENMDGDDADILIVDIANGHLLAHAEDPIVNPGLLVIGFERGVDLVRWTDNELVAPLEARGFDPGLVVLDIDGAMVDSFFDANLLGFQRSVDPIVAPLAPPALIVPIQDEGFDTDVMVFTEPPNLDEGYRLENENLGLELGRFEVDVDLGLVDKTKWGELFICIPEEEPGGGDARLRFELTAGLPGDRVLAMVTRASGLLPSSFYLIDIPTGDIIIEKNDLLGLELGLDMVNGQGPVTPGEFPFFILATGLDLDPDSTLVVAPRIPEDLEELIDAIEGLDLDDFSNEHRIEALVNKIEAVIKMVESGDLDSLCEAIQKLKKDILRKTDGEKPPPDWVIDPIAQQTLADLINAIIDALEEDANALGGCSDQEQGTSQSTGSALVVRVLGC
jgi:hypothetical protein